MKTLRYSALTVLLLLFLLASCKEIKKSIEATLHPTPQKKAVSADNDNNTSSTVIFSSSSTYSTTQQQNYKSIFESAVALDSIQQGLRDMPHLKGKYLFFLHGFHFYDYQGGMISIDLQDPDKPENVDTYTYSNGEWQMQQPVRITGHYPLKLLLMPLDEVKFSTAKKVYDTGVEKSKTVEGAGTITHVYFNQVKVVHVKEWYIMINGSRRNYRLKFDADGTFRVME
jgi:hypothetical protein